MLKERLAEATEELEELRAEQAAQRKQPVAAMGSARAPAVALGENKENVQ